MPLPERSFEHIKTDISSGHRKRENIANDLLISARTEEHTQRLILETLLDIRDLLNDLLKKEK